MSVERLAELSYDTAIRALDLQERGVEQLRARTGTLLAASSLAASFLGSQSLRSSDGVGVVDVLALVALAGSMVICTYVLLPKSDFKFSLNAARIYESLFEFAHDDHEVRRRLVYWLEAYWQSNEKKLNKLDRLFVAAAFTLLFQILCWSWSLVATIP